MSCGGLTCVVIYSDRYGRVSHCVTDRATQTLAELVLDGVIAGADRGRAIKAASMARVLWCGCETRIPALAIREQLRWIEFCDAWCKIGNVYNRTHGREDDDAHESYGG